MKGNLRRKFAKEKKNGYKEYGFEEGERTWLRDSEGILRANQPTHDLNNFSQHCRERCVAGRCR